LVELANSKQKQMNYEISLVFTLRSSLCWIEWKWKKNSRNFKKKWNNRRTI